LEKNGADIRGTADKEALMSWLNEPRSSYSIQYVGHVMGCFLAGVYSY